MKKKTRQIIAVAALVAFLLFCLFGTVGIILSVSHNCTGIHCHTCERIAAIQTVVSILKIALTTLAVCLFISEFLYLHATKMLPQFMPPTSVSLKTKLNS